MTPEHSYQLLTWLDEEHRKDKATLSQIVAQLDQHLTQISGLAKGLQDLEERLARMQSQALRYSQIEQALGQVKTEVNLMFEQYERRSQQREAEQLEIRQRERERTDKALEQLGARIEELAAGQRFVMGDHDAIKRLEGGQATFVRGLEELNKRLETLNARMQVAEEWMKRMGALMAEIQQLAERLRQDRAETLEALRRADQARARQITEWNEQMKATRREMDDWIAQLRPLLEMPKETRGYLALLRELEASLKQVEPRLMQRQKMQEEFMRKELDTIKSELEKRENLALQEIEHIREDWSRKMVSLMARLDPLDEWRPQVMEQFRELRERMDADRLRFVNLLADVLQMQIEYGRQANARFEQLASDLITRVETERASAKVKRPPPPPRPPEE